MSLTTTLCALAAKNSLLTVKEAAEFLGLSPWWVRQLIHSGELRAINLSGPERAARWRIDPEDVLALMRSRENRSRDLWAA